jgi:hypothetical protein
LNGVEFLTPFLHDDITCINIHPSGHFALVGQQQKLMMCNILLDGLQVQYGKEYSAMRGCREAKFRCEG